MDTAFEHEIRQRAYAIWVASGMNEGEAEAHWLHAERTLRTDAEAAVVSTASEGKTEPAKTKPAKTKAVKTKVAKPKAAAPKATAAARTNAAPRRPETGPLEAVA